MTKDDLREVILLNDNEIRALLLTKHQKKLLQYIQQLPNLGLTASILSTMHNKSIQNASSQLAKLFQKGYLTRSEHIHSTGGIIYNYKSKFPDTLINI